MRASSLLSPEVSGTGALSDMGFRVGEVTLDGTIELVLFVGIFTGLFGAVYYAISRPWLMWAGEWRGAVFGLLLFAIGSATSDAVNPDNSDFVVLDNIPMIILLFFALFILFGVTVAWLHDWLDRRLPTAEGSTAMVVVYTLASLVSLVFVGGAFVMLGTREGCDCDPPLVAGVAFMILAAVTVALWIASRSTNRGAKVMSALTTVGWVSLAIAFIAGAARAISDISEIIAL
jgi:FtsH-binding integral membrane protein